jgi:exopolyphosphatase/guanosine-5'-triphosphate,3'-diphosphate pyrophosphatase
VNMNRATIDIGSNTVLLLLAQLDPFREIAKLSEVCALGKGLDKNGVFAEESMDAAFKALSHYRDVCQEHGVSADQIIATATEAARVAKNAKDFFAKVKTQLGIRIQIITGKAEAELTTKGVLFNSSLPDREAVIMDIGGASTELIRVRPPTGEIVASVSLPVGSVRVSEWLQAGTFTGNLRQIFSRESDSLDSFRTDTLYCVAGTLTSIGNMFLGHKEFVENEVHGLRLRAEAVDQLFSRCGDWKPEKFLSEFPFLGKRSEAIRGGLNLAHHMLHRLKASEVVVSTYGLRYGTFLQGGIKHEQLV